MEPEARLLELVDAFGNRYHHFALLQPVERIAVTVRARVQTTAAPLPEAVLSP